MRRIGIVCLTYLIISSCAIAQEEALKLVIVSPGGPSAKKVDKYIGQFTGIIADRVGIGEESVTGRYFTDRDAALDFLDKNRDSFIISSLSFYLSQRKSLDLIPLARIELSAGAARHFYLVAKKGVFHNLDELKGKTISGSALYQDPRFLSRIVFANRVDLTSDFILQPNPRTLSALRKLVKGKLDGVLLDEIQYKSLASLPFSDEIAVVYTSPVLPEVGLMMIDTPVNRELKDRLLAALNSLGDSREGAEAFKSFGMIGFRPMETDALNKVIMRYDDK